MNEDEKRLRSLISNQANRLLDVVLEQVRKEAFEKGQDVAVKRLLKEKP
ncbi:MAG: hypothetical protein KGJ23_07900 [Euryarchaeota archaeon]|nr:hypothetical protein [Euryarchaeota archaeon]MDE1836523.1 hypothetical protein [Euryarchaeota archaeon]MDE1879282.1 hypothetical protein [Euryarchaeota archaeon]MDE2044493.1 hypothetical protein [Thermoplasmata archaeon]